jgi:hypothetical protein
VVGKIVGSRNIAIINRMAANSFRKSPKLAKSRKATNSHPSFFFIFNAIDGLGVVILKRAVEAIESRLVWKIYVSLRGNMMLKIQKRLGESNRSTVSLRGRIQSQQVAQFSVLLEARTTSNRVGGLQKSSLWIARQQISSCVGNAGP